MRVVTRWAAESAPVTNWPLRAALVMAVIAIILMVLLAMRRGWRRRGASQADLPAPAPAPDALEPRDLGPVTGIYIASTTAGNWLDRIVVHDLGVRSRAELEVGPQGVLLRRQGARDLFIPADDLRDARGDRGIAGKVYERGGVLVMTWDLGGRLVDTGFRADGAEDQVSAVETVMSMVADERTA